MNQTDHRYRAISFTDFGISVYFVFEIALRMFAMTLAIYFSKRYWYNIIDSIIVAVGLILSVVDILFIFVFYEVFQPIEIIAWIYFESFIYNGKSNLYESFLYLSLKRKIWKKPGWIGLVECGQWLFWELSGHWSFFESSVSILSIIRYLELCDKLLDT